MRRVVLSEILAMAWDSLRTHKMRSALTVLGIVIGITMVVGMTSMVRGFDQTMTSQLQSMGPDTLYLVKWGGRLITSHEEFRRLMARPDITADDAESIQEQAETVDRVSIMYGGGFPASTARVRHRGESSNEIQVFGVGPRFLDAGDMELGLGRFISPLDMDRRSDVVVLGHGPAEALFPAVDPIGRRVRIRGREYRVVGTIAGRKVGAVVGPDADNFALVPATNHRKLYGPRPGNAMIVMRARPGVDIETMIQDVEGIMRARHRLRADQEPDFDIMTQESLMEMWRQLTTAFFLALVALSSVALMVGGVGVMAIMLVSVTERTREIGLRKALGARRVDILQQFLAEAVALAATGGLLGVALGAAVGWTAHLVTEWPISLPWWSFAIGVGFSSLVGLFFGIYPANRAARLDPIDALRYE